MTPEVTIIIPTRNRAHFLEQSLTSALAQTWQNIEVLVLDNASDDETPRVLTQFSDSRLRVVRHPELIVMQENWGFGLREARGEFVIFLGDDDLLHLNAAESRLTCARKYQASAVFSAHERVSEDASCVLQRVPSPALKPGPVNREKALSMALGIEFWIGSTLYLRSRALEIWPVLGPDETAFDVGLNSRLAFHDAILGRVSYTGEGDVSWRQHPAQATKGDVSRGWELKMKYLHRLRDEAPDRACRRILTRAISSWRTWLGWQLSGNAASRSQSRRLLASAIKTDPGNVWAWKMAVKCMLLNAEKPVASFHRAQ